MCLAFPDPNSFSGKVLLSIIDKLALGIAVSIAGLLIGHYWAAASVRSDLIKTVPKIISDNTFNLTTSILQLPKTSGSDLLLLRSGIETKLVEVTYWIRLSEKITGYKCESPFLETITDLRSRLASITLATSLELAGSIETTYPSLISCIQQFQKHSISWSDL